MCLGNSLTKKVGWADKPEGVSGLSAQPTHCLAMLHPNYNSLE